MITEKDLESKCKLTGECLSDINIARFGVVAVCYALVVAAKIIANAILRSRGGAQNDMHIV